jgi:D-hexose-6-phosphate mutarotase
MFTASSITAGRNGQPMVRLESSDGAHSCEIYLYGCCVASWVHNNTEKLFCSPITPFDGKKAIRGAHFPAAAAAAADALPTCFH